MVLWLGAAILLMVLILYWWRVRRLWKQEQELETLLHSMDLHNRRVEDLPLEEERPFQSILEEKIDTQEKRGEPLRWKPHNLS